MEKTLIFLLLPLAVVLVSGCIQDTKNMAIPNASGVLSLDSAGLVDAVSSAEDTMNGILGNEKCEQTEMWGWVCINDDYDFEPLPGFTMQEYNDIKMPKALIGDGHTWWIKCGSNSMYPTFNCTDTLVALSPKDKYALDVNDIVFYSRGNDYDNDMGQFVIHRIIDKAYIDGKQYYVLKGDNNHYIDDYMIQPWQVKYKIIGKLIT